MMFDGFLVCVMCGAGVCFVHCRTVLNLSVDEKKREGENVE